MISFKVTHVFWNGTMSHTLGTKLGAPITKPTYVLCRITSHTNISSSAPSYPHQYFCNSHWFGIGPAFDSCNTTPYDRNTVYVHTTLLNVDPISSNWPPTEARTDESPGLFWGASHFCKQGSNNINDFELNFKIFEGEINVWYIKYNADDNKWEIVNMTHIAASPENLRRLDFV